MQPASAMPANVDITTKLSYLLPTGTFMTFQVLAPLATNNGKCNLTEQVVTAIMLGILLVGCIVTSFTDSYTAPDGKVYDGFLTYHGLWVPGYGAPDRSTSSPADANQNVASNGSFIPGPMFKPMAMDYINAALSAIAFLALTMFTDPVCTCFYPNLSETILKTLPVLLATVLSFCCSYTTKIRHGFGNCVSRLVPAPDAVPSLDSSRVYTNNVDSGGLHDATSHRGNHVV